MRLSLKAYVDLAQKLCRLCSYSVRFRAWIFSLGLDPIPESCIPDSILEFLESHLFYVPPYLSIKGQFDCRFSLRVARENKQKSAHVLRSPLTGLSVPRTTRQLL